MLTKEFAGRQVKFHPFTFGRMLRLYNGGDDFDFMGEFVEAIDDAPMGEDMDAYADVAGAVGSFLGAKRLDWLQNTETNPTDDGDSTTSSEASGPTTSPSS